MAPPFGFEGFEKRLELHFSGEDVPECKMGLRSLDFKHIDDVLCEVQCTVVSAMGNSYFDAYVLSESSLFVYPTKIIIKTCGTTQLLRSIHPLIHLARSLGLYLTCCKYTRGSFFFPEAQPFPHTSFEEEIRYIEVNLPANLRHRKASIMPVTIYATTSTWHVFVASDEESLNDQIYTIEVCMTELDRSLARKFFRLPGDEKPGDLVGKEMTELTGIQDLSPIALVCDVAFDPCGYSMNGMEGDLYSTIHVTPEEGYSYASYECIGSSLRNGGMRKVLFNVLSKVARIFRPGTMSIAISYDNNSKYDHDLPMLLANELKRLGLKEKSHISENFPATQTIVFQMFTGNETDQAGF